MRLLFDIEANGLLHATDKIPEATKVHSLVIRDLDSGTVWSCHDHGSVHSIGHGLSLLAEADEVCGHKIMTFDLPCLMKLYPVFRLKEGCKIVDTLVCSRVIWPDIKDMDYKLQGTTGLPAALLGSHGLEAWGYRLGSRKGGVTSFEFWTPEMQAYCEQDVAVNVKLRLKVDSKKFSQEALDLEHEFQAAIHLQEETGFSFDEVYARGVYAEMAAKRDELVRKLQQVFPPTIETLKTPAYWEGATGALHGVARFTTKGEAQKARAKDIKPGPLRTKEHPFNPNSSQQVAERLGEKYGWKPVAFTPSGQAKIDDEILEDLPFPEARLLSEYYVLGKRIAQLAEGDQGWLKKVKGGRLYGEVITNGAVTGRCTHKLVVNVPKHPQPWGKEMRSCFTATPGWWLVGADASGLEARNQGHFMQPFDDGAFIKIILEGKKSEGTAIHQVNCRALGLTVTTDNYEAAKKWYYAFIYGSGAFKSGLIIEVVSDTPLNDEMIAEFNGLKHKRLQTYATKWLTKENIPVTSKNIAMYVRGALLKTAFLDATPALKQLINEVQDTARRDGCLYGLDGRKLNVRAVYSALNTLLQSAGAIVMKKALCILMRKLKAKGWVHGTQFRLLANMHDEVQAECPTKDLATEFGKAAVESIREAGEHFKFRCPLDGEFKVGKNWHDTH